MSCSFFSPSLIVFDNFTLHSLRVELTHLVDFGLKSDLLCYLQDNQSILDHSFSILKKKILKTFFIFAFSKDCSRAEMNSLLFIILEWVFSIYV